MFKRRTHISLSLSKSNRCATQMDGEGRRAVLLLLVDCQNNALDQGHEEQAAVATLNNQVCLNEVQLVGRIDTNPSSSRIIELVIVLYAGQCSGFSISSPFTGIVVGMAFIPVFRNPGN